MRKPALPMPINLADPRLKPHSPVVATDAQPWYKIRNETESGGAAEVMIYGTIGASFWSDGVSASDFARELNDIDADEITVRINSQGGSVFEGIAILNALRGHEAKIVTVVDGLAASAASFIAMAGDEIVMGRNAEMMIHDASGLCVGNAADMQFMTDLLDKTSDNIAAIYADRAGGTAKQWRTAMTAETWYSDREAVAAGLADRIDKGTSKTDTGTKNFDLSVFNYAGRREAPTPAFPANSPANRAGATKKEQQMPQTLKEAIAKRLGMSADASDDDLIEKLETEEEGEPKPAEEGEPKPATEGEPKPAEQGEPKPAEQAEPTPGAENRSGTPGTVVVDEQRLADLEAGNQRLNTFLEAQAAAERKVVIDNAVKAGKIPSQRRDHWSNLLAKDPGIADVLAAMPAGSAVPVGEVGHGIDGGEAGQSTSASAAEDIRNTPEFKNWSM